jgi:hypothetical protein
MDPIPEAILDPLHKVWYQVGLPLYPYILDQRDQGVPDGSKGAPPDWGPSGGPNGVVFSGITDSSP